MRSFWGALRRYFRDGNRDLSESYLVRFLSVGAGLSIAAFVGITAAVGWRSVWQTAIRADWFFVIFVPLAVAVSHVGYALSYREVAHYDGRDKLGIGDALALVVSGFGPVSPRGGSALDVQELKKRGVSQPDAEQRVRVLGMVEYAVLAPATLVAAIYMLVSGIQAQPGLVQSWVIGVPLGAALAIGCLVLYHRSGNPQSWWQPLRHFLDALDDLVDLLRAWRKSPLACVGMIIYWTGEIVALGCCIDVFAHRRGAVAVMVVGYATGYALTRRSLPFAGAGVVEALLPFALEWVGFALAASILAVILYRLFNLWLAMIPGVIALRRVHRLSRPRRRASAKRPPARAKAGAS